MFVAVCDCLLFTFLVVVVVGCWLLVVGWLLFVVCSCLGSGFRVKLFIHNPNMQDLNPKKLNLKKMRTPNPKPYKLKTPGKRVKG